MASSWRISTQFMGPAAKTAPTTPLRQQQQQLPQPTPGPALLDGKLYLVPPMPRADTFRP